ncbi:hypothetical protein LTR85_002518 [Meristemomyces frigidus]|nr:hypothetical protein LTR85_002518 [Meristemomyces frigidus]
MGTTDWKPYNLPRDKGESNRLNLQHKLYIANTGFLLHPRIAAALPENAHIAEIGTGTGAWLKDLAAESPQSWTYTGFDISDAQFPQQHGSGPCRFTNLNILEDVPEKYREQFDVVHLRLLVCGLSGKDWTTTARNVFRLLRPGGWIQWHESDFVRMQFLQNAPDASTAVCRELVDFVFARQIKDGKMLDDVVQLAQSVGNAGFQECNDYVFSSDRVAETREAMNDVEHDAVCSLARHTVQANAETGWTMGKVDEMAERGRQELEGGKAYSRWNMHLITGRKPGG